jgi:cytochrome c553
MIRRIFKWLAYGAAGLLTLMLIGVASVYAYTSWEFAQSYDHVTGKPVPMPSGEEAVEQGRRLANLRGCYHGCHGDESEGGVFFELPDGTRVVAPDLHRIAAEYSDAELERAIRHGVRPDGTSVFGVMPSKMFYHLSDEDVGRIIAFLRSGEPSGTELPESRYGPMLRGMMLVFRKDGFDSIAARSVDHDAPRIPAGGADPAARGRYLAMTTCVECHGADLNGGLDGTPSLVVVKAYNQPEFEHLLRTGEPRSGAELDLMAKVATGRFKNFTDQELADIYAFLQQR